MLKKAFLFQFIMIGVVLHLSGQNYLRDELDRTTIHCLESVSQYEDRHGNFHANLVAILDDGSQWKVHPDDTIKFGHWEAGDELHVAFRTSFYWWRRQHHFELVNHTLNQSVRAMFVQYPDEKLEILDVLVRVTDQVTRFTYLSNGNGNTYLHTWHEYSYVKTLFLSNGLVVSYQEGPVRDPFTSSLDGYQKGKTIYLGCNKYNESCSYFIIQGKGEKVSSKWVELTSSLSRENQVRLTDCPNPKVRRKS